MRSMQGPSNPGRGRVTHDGPSPPHASAARAPSPTPKLPLHVALTRSRLRRYPTQLVESLLQPASRGGAGPQPGVQPAPIELDLSSAAGPISAAWLGHASVLLRLADRWILTDPVFSERIGVSLGPITVGVSRKAPTIDFSQLPHIDLVLLSHAHFDHLDKPTLRRLASPSTRVVTAANTRGLIPPGFGDVRELRWGQQLRLGPMLLRALRPEHWGARTAWDRHRGYNAYVLEADAVRQHRSRVLFAGDTAHSDAFHPLGAEGGVDLSIFGIGAYDPWIAKHATPEQVWEMHTAAGGRHLLPMHHSTFELSDEPMDEPLRRLINAAGSASPNIVATRLGEIWSMPHGA